MCFDQKTSLFAFSISVFCFVYLVYYGIKNNNKYDILAGVDTIAIGLIQLTEFFLWGVQDCEKTNANHYISLFIMFVLYIQILIFVFINIYLFPITQYDNYYFKIIYKHIQVICLSFTIFTGYLLYWLNKHRLCSKPTENSCRLAWAPFHVLSESLYGVLLLIIFAMYYFVLGWFGFKNMNNKYTIRNYLIRITAIIATIYSCSYGNVVDTFGSLWCFFSVFYGIIAILHI